MHQIVYFRDTFFYFISGAINSVTVSSTFPLSYNFFRVEKKGPKKRIYLRILGYYSVDSSKRWFWKATRAKKCKFYLQA